MRILVIGGSRFVGRYTVEAALARGHEVTVFNRGKSGPGLHPQVEEIHGDRDGGMEVLRGRAWDAVVDTCGYVPRVVKQSADVLADAVKQYVFISTLSVYADFAPNTDESYTLATVDDPTSENVNEHYGALKALSEQVLDEAMPGRVLHVRAGLIVGPNDYTGRFTYWVRRAQKGGDIVVPNNQYTPLQLIDVRDLAAWVIDKIEDGTTGAFNVTGPAQPLTFTQMINVLRDTVDPSLNFTWVDEEFLLANEVKPFADLPLWIETNDHGFMMRRIDKALAAGLRLRPLSETIRDTAAWLNSPDWQADTAPKAGWSSEEEEKLLEAWSEHQSEQE